MLQDWGRGQPSLPGKLKRIHREGHGHRVLKEQWSLHMEEANKERGWNMFGSVQMTWLFAGGWWRSTDGV